MARPAAAAMAGVDCHRHIATLKRTKRTHYYCRHSHKRIRKRAQDKYTSRKNALNDVGSLAIGLHYLS